MMRTQEVHVFYEAHE